MERGNRRRGQPVQTFWFPREKPMTKKKRHGEEAREGAWYATVVEIWRLHQYHDPLDFALGTDEDERKFAAWLKLPKVAITLLDEMNANGLKCDDLRAWERWPDRELFMRTLEMEKERVEERVDALREAAEKEG